MHNADLIIVGGGAAGLASAIFAAECAPPDHRIVLLDGARTLGAKILVSGGGRCNVTHHQVLPQDFNGSPNIVRNILAAFDAAATVAWFETLGVKLKREPTGKLFPITDSARTVLSALVRRCQDLNITIQTASRVTQIIPPDAAGGFTVVHESGSITAPRVIVCAGGRSLPRSGSDGSGWEILRALGHTVTPTYAALVPLVLAPQMFHAQLAGISQDVELSTFVANKLVDRRTGSLLWTHFGISGPVVMDASRHWTIARETNQDPRMHANLLPDETFETAERWLIQSTSQRPRASMLNHLSERLPERVAAAILQHVGIDPATTAGQLARDLRRALVQNQFDERKLQEAHKIASHKALADVISIVKHAAQGQEPVLTAEERVNQAMNKLIAKSKFTTEQLQWLSLVREQLIKNLTIDEDDFDNTPLLQGRGGSAKAKRVFGKLNLLVAQLNEAVAA
jgi:predicted Rossmann fold flavoprotein